MHTAYYNAYIFSMCFRSCIELYISSIYFYYTHIYTCISTLTTVYSSAYILCNFD